MVSERNVQRTLDGKNPFMTIRDLIEHLKTFDQELEVYYRTSDDYEECCYRIITRENTIETNILISDAKDPDYNKEIRVCVIGEIED